MEGKRATYSVVMEFDDQAAADRAVARIREWLAEMGIQGASVTVKDLTPEQLAQWERDHPDHQKL